MIPFSVNKKTTLDVIKALFPAMTFARITLGYTALFLLIRFLLLQWLPELDVNWITFYFHSLLFGIAIVVFVSLTLFIPPIVRVGKHGVAVQRGQSSTFYSCNDISSIRIEADAKPFPLLKINFISMREARELPISPKISLECLAALIDTYRFNR